MNTFKKVAGSAKRTSEPGLVGVILQDYFEDSNEPLAVAYRSLFPDTHLGVDLKVMNDEPKHMDVGETLDGTLARDGEYHFLFRKEICREESKGCTSQSHHLCWRLRQRPPIGRWHEASGVQSSALLP